MISNAKWYILVLILSLLLVSGCQQEERTGEMNANAEEKEILKIIDLYVQAVNDANVDLLESLFWKDDPHFTEVENDRAFPFGGEHFSEICQWIRQHGKPAKSQRFYDTQVHILTPETAYTVSLRDELNNNKTSRVSLLYLKKGDQWKIIHGHFSYVPE